ncbi:Carbohydrate binding domain-containing protein [Histomonas meleagridis]|uniref:Carbohydrate binding domain-containing protein n=1 Tax=Histomonas meleagridis TaxID=135588 RepID=UPI0035593C48|nr:Carbohydrate binding domain-containing protein [Histomonas meleagridis]KAH0803043.1 Carbohydrate binding domain-containing protein [Histomonas meleagridis]
MFFLLILVRSFDTFITGYGTTLTKDSEGWFTFPSGHEVAYTSEKIECNPGDSILITVETISDNNGYISAGVAPWKSDGNVNGWVVGLKYTLGDLTVQQLTTYCVIPKDTVSFSPSIVFYGSQLKFRSMNYQILDHYDLPETTNVVLENTKLKVNFDNLNITVLDKITSREWTQVLPEEEYTVIVGNTISTSTYLFTLFKEGELYYINFTLNDDTLTYTINCDESSTKEIPKYPYAFISKIGDKFIIPYGEGFSYPSNQGTIKTDIGSINGLWFGMWELSMPFIGLTDDKSSMIILYDTPYDGESRTSTYSLTNTYSLWHYFSLVKGKFSYKRQIRYIFIQGNHVQIAKRYREVAKSKGLLKTFKEKVKENPNIDKLIGSVNVWLTGYWDLSLKNKDIYHEMQSLGIQKILSSSTIDNEVNWINENMKDIITSRYDNYQDQYDPEWLEKGYVSDLGHSLPGAYPNDLLIDENGDYKSSWTTTNLSNPNQQIPLPVLCDKQAIPYAKQRLNEEKTNDVNYQCRFIDTTMATEYRECYHANHLMTKIESKDARVELLKYFHDEEKIIIGTEDGRDVAIPYCDYFEGILTPVRFRPPLNQLWEHYDQALDYILENTVNENVRIPLFELVYHDCVISYWHWNDHNSKVTSIWDKKNLFNVLYGLPSMFVLDQSFWNNNKNKFVETYNMTFKGAYESGYHEMTDHVYLTEDMKVQQTKFENGLNIIVNFGAENFVYNGMTISAQGYVLFYDDQEIENTSEIEEDNTSDVKEDNPSGVDDDDDNDNEGNSGMKSWEIAVIVVVVVVVLIVGGVVGFFVYRKTRKDIGSEDEPDI